MQYGLYSCDRTFCNNTSHGCVPVLFQRVCGNKQSLKSKFIHIYVCFSECESLLKLLVAIIRSAGFFFFKHCGVIWEMHVCNSNHHFSLVSESVRLSFVMPVFLTLLWTFILKLASLPPCKGACIYWKQAAKKLQEIISPSPVWGKLFLAILFPWQCWWAGCLVGMWVGGLGCREPLQLPSQPGYFNNS